MQGSNNPHARKKCGAKVRQGGACENCHAKGERNVRHGGKCPQCGGQMRCVNSPITGHSSGRCRMHGGKGNNPGPTHPNYTKGLTSKMPITTDLIRKVEEAMEHERLLSLRQEAAILSVRLNEILEGDPASDFAAISEVEKTYDQIVDALAEGDNAAAAQLLREMGGKIKRAKSNASAWCAVERVIEKRRRVVATERDLMTKAGNMLSVAQAMHAINQIVAVIVDQVKDRKVLSEVRSRYRLIVGEAINESE